MPASQRASCTASVRPKQAVARRAGELSLRGWRTGLPVSVYCGHGGAQSGPRIRLVLRDKSVIAERPGPARSAPLLKLKPQ